MLFFFSYLNGSFSKHFQLSHAQAVTVKKAFIRSVHTLGQAADFFLHELSMYNPVFQMLEKIAFPAYSAGCTLSLAQKKTFGAGSWALVFLLLAAVAAWRE